MVERFWLKFGTSFHFWISAQVFHMQTSHNFLTKKDVNMKFGPETKQKQKKEDDATKSPILHYI